MLWYGNRFILETLGSQPIMSQILPDTDGHSMDGYSLIDSSVGRVSGPKTGLISRILLLEIPLG
jgi:hypothetical protein